MKLRFCFLLLLFISVFTMHGQSQRKVAVLNMNLINAESNNSRFQSTLNMIKLAGIPFDTTSFINIAIKYPVIVTGSRITDSSLTTIQRSSLINYVDSGGVLISSSLRDTALFNLFGISFSDSDNNLVSITWDTTLYPQYFNLINDSLEVTVSIGDTSEVNFYSRAYTLLTAQSLGNYEDGRCALAKNQYGLGKTFLFGPDFRDILLRNQLNMDLEAQRKYSNGFEVSSDVFVFLLRNIIRESIPTSIYKHTSPYNTTSVLLITHDVDSKSAIDSLHLFSAYETSKGIVAQYNVTTRYMSDHWMSNYYSGPNLSIDSLTLLGHVIGSHSVGHFPDYANDSLFHFGTLGSTSVSYNPAYFFGTTTGGTVLGEMEVSKLVLENDYGVPIRSFRAGHLCYPDSMGMGLVATNYQFNSTQSANDALTGFPYFVYDRKSFSGNPTGVLEIPMMISDVFKDNPISDTNAISKVGIWIDDIIKYDANNSPVNLLIHPNRLFKLDALKRLLDSLPNQMDPYPFEEFGEFWRKRDSLQFHTILLGDTLIVKMENEIDVRQSFILDHIGLDTVRFFDKDSTELFFFSQYFCPQQRLYYQQGSTYSLENNFPQEIKLFIFPNPCDQYLMLILGKPLKNGKLQIYDINGKIYADLNLAFGIEHKLDISSFITSPGMYFLKVFNDGESGVTKFVVK